MSALLEQTVEELGYLIGATVTGISVEGDEESETLVLHFKTVAPVEDDVAGKSSNLVSVEVWQDVEGNGPGYLALTSIDEP